LGLGWWNWVIQKKTAFMGTECVRAQPGEKESLPLKGGKKKDLQVYPVAIERSPHCGCQGAAREGAWSTYRFYCAKRSSRTGRGQGAKC